MDIKKAGNKARQRLGLTDETLLNDYVKRISSTEDLGDCKMLVGDYAGFWDGMIKPKLASLYISHLIELLISMEKKAGSFKKSKGAISPSNSLTLETCAANAAKIIHTIRYASLFLTIDVNVVEAVKKWEFFAYASTTINFTKLNSSEYIKLLNKIHVHKESMVKFLVHEAICDLKKFIRFNADLNSTIPAPLATLLDDNVEESVQNLDVIDIGEDFPYAYIYLKSLIGGDSEDVEEIFEYIPTLLEQLKNSRKGAEVTKSVYISILHLLKDLICHYPLADKEYVDNLILLIRRYYTWPNPCGVATANLLTILEDEIKSPGSALRKRIFSENPLLSASGEILISQHIESFEKIVQFSYLQRTVMVYHGDTCVNSKIYRSLFDEIGRKRTSGDYSVPDTAVYNVQLQTLRIQLLYSIIEVDLTFNDALTHDDEVLGFEDHEPSNVLYWYAQAREIMTEASEVSELFIKSYRESFLSDLVQSITPAPVFPVRYDKSGKKSKSNFSRSVKGVQLPAMPIVFKKTGFNLSHLPQALDLNVFFEPLKKENISFTFPDASKYGLKIINYGEETAKMMSLLQHHLDVLPLMKEAEMTVRDEEAKVNFDKPIVKLCVMGNDPLFHRFLCNYVAVQYELQDSYFLQEVLDVRLYTIPMSDSTISNFIAQRDPWYRTQIYSAFHTLQVQTLPQVTQTSPAAVVMPEFSPIGQSKNLMEDYFRGAENKLNVKVYLCECWVLLSNNEMADIVIPFCINLELGVCVDIARFNAVPSNNYLVENEEGLGSRKKNNKHGEATVLNDKGFQKQTGNGVTCDLRMEYNKIHFNGEVDPRNVEVIPAAYGRISLSNFPDTSESTTDPEAPGLRLSNLSVGHKKYLDLLRKREKTSKELDSLIDIIFNEGEITDVSNMKIEVEDESNSFPIIIDGKVFGPFQKIRVTPFSLDNKHVVLPIMTYLPITSM